MQKKVEVLLFFCQVPLVLVSWSLVPYPEMLNFPSSCYGEFELEALRTSPQSPVLGTKSRGASVCWGGNK